jgi:hypothetical protein
MLEGARAHWRALTGFPDYKPQPVGIRELRRWISQFESSDRRWLYELVNHVTYLDERQVREALVQQNDALLQRLRRDAIDIEHVVYVQHDEPASSSGSMLNMLRDAANLERSGCRFVDGADGIALNAVTDELAKGAIVYVDDFLGTGNQFAASHKTISQAIVGTFAEFFVAPVICDEAVYRLGEIGVYPFPFIVHSRAERPLHDNAAILPPAAKQRLAALALDMDQAQGLGYKRLATMVVLYRNCPNTTPLLLRGNLGQSPRVGLFPRFADFPRPVFD